jgi:hypothetical protein
MADNAFKAVLQRASVGHIRFDEHQIGIVEAIAVASMDSRAVIRKVEHGDPGAFIGKARCKGVAELAETAGDDDDAILEIEPVFHFLTHANQECR